MEVKSVPVILDIISIMSSKKLALFDIDKTIYDGYVIFPLADYQFKRKIIDKKCLNSLYEDLKLYKDKKVDYESTVENLNLHYAAGLNNLSYKKILKQTKEFFTSKEGDKFYPFVNNLIRLLQKTHDIYFITGELQFIGQAAFELFLVKGYISSELEIKSGLFNKRIKKSLAKRIEKKAAIHNLLQKYNINQSFAFGDSEGDIEMLNSVAYPICVNPTEGLQRVAKNKKWIIVKPDNITEAVKKKLISTTQFVAV